MLLELYQSESKQRTCVWILWDVIPSKYEKDCCLNKSSLMSTFSMNALQRRPYDSHPKVVYSTSGSSHYDKLTYIEL